jgi:hypothetical protein
MIYKNKFQKEIAFLSGKIKKSEYLKEDKVDSERFQMNALSKVADSIDNFINSLNYLKKDFFDPPEMINSPTGPYPAYQYGARYKDVTEEEKNRVKEMVYELLKDKVKLIDASIDKIFENKSKTSDEDGDEEDEE